MLKQFLPCRVRFPSPGQHIGDEKFGPGPSEHTGLLFDVVCVTKIEFRVIFKDPISIDPHGNVSIIPMQNRKFNVFTGNSFMSTCYRHWDVNGNLSKKTPYNRDFVDNAEVEFSPCWLRLKEIFPIEIRRCQADIDRWSLNTRFPVPNRQIIKFVDEYRHVSPIKRQKLFGHGADKPHVRRQSGIAESVPQEIAASKSNAIFEEDDDDDHTEIDEPINPQAQQQQQHQSNLQCRGSITAAASQTPAVVQQRACSSSDELSSDYEPPAKGVSSGSGILPLLPTKTTIPVIPVILQSQFTQFGVWVTRSIDNVIEDTVISTDMFPLTITSSNVTIGNGIQPVWNKRKSYKSPSPDDTQHLPHNDVVCVEETQETRETQAKRHKSVSFAEASAETQQPFKIAQPVALISETTTPQQQQPVKISQSVALLSETTTPQQQPFKIAQSITPRLATQSQPSIEVDQPTLNKPHATQSAFPFQEAAPQKVPITSRKLFQTIFQPSQPPQAIKPLQPSQSSQAIKPPSNQTSQPSRKIEVVLSNPASQQINPINPSNQSNPARQKRQHPQQFNRCQGVFTSGPASGSQCRFPALTTRDESGKFTRCRMHDLHKSK